MTNKIKALESLINRLIEVKLNITKKGNDELKKDELETLNSLIIITGKKVEKEYIQLSQYVKIYKNKVKNIIASIS